MARPLTLQPPQDADPNRYIHTGARLSACGRYRYKLWREWRGTHDPKNWRWFGENDGDGQPLGEPKSVLFVMLNPSTADGKTDDPTIRRCAGFARAWNYERLEVVTLYAYRATRPADLFAFAAQGGDPIGWENSEIIERAALDAGLVVCAWGANADNAFHIEEVRGWMSDKPHFALGFTKDGHPRHPLYVRLDAQLVPMPA